LSRENAVTAKTNPANPANQPSGNSVNGNSVRVEIYDQVYNLRGSDPDYILKLGEYVDAKMRTIAEQTQTVDSLRLAVLAAINIADEFHMLKRKYESNAALSERATNLSGALDEILAETRRVS
jgi:cell division protein ZapA